jgi:uracil-DNA glycosylase family 4
MVTNAVRCAPPGNRPTPEEGSTCRPFLAARIASLPRLRAIVTLGDVSRRNVIARLAADRPRPPQVTVSKWTSAQSGCSAATIARRLNTNTGRLTPEMFHAVFASVRRHLDQPGS